LLCSFHCKPRLSEVSLVSPRLENIPQIPRNRAEVGQNPDASKAVSATLLVLKWTGAIFRSRRSKVNVQKVLLCPFHCKPRPSEVSLESPGVGNIYQVPGNRAKVCQKHDARKAVSVTLSVLKWSRTIFRPRSSKLSVQKVFLRPFHCKPRHSGVMLASPWLENISQVPANRPEVAQNYQARNAVSDTLSVFKWRRALFRPRSSKVSAEKNLLYPFHYKPRPSGVSLESPGLENIPQVPANRPEVGQNYQARKAVSTNLSVLKWSGEIFRLRRSKVSV